MAEMPAVSMLRSLGVAIGTLRQLHAEPTAATLAQWSDQISEVLAEEERRWLSEDRCRRRGRSLRWLRQRFAGWEQVGVARWRDGRREYHELVVPVQVLELPASDAREQARRDAAA